MSEQHELRIERVFDAPIDAVWRAWRERKPDWFCPPPWRVEVVEEDLRAGGRSSLVMHGPEGEAMPMEGVFLAVEPGRRVVSTDALTADWQPQGPFMVRIELFEPDGERTRYTAIARHWTAEAKAQHEAMGFEAGWGLSADQLGAVAKTLATA